MRQVPYLRLVEPSQAEALQVANDDDAQVAMEVFNVIGWLIRKVLWIAFWIALGLMAGLAL